MSESYQKGVYYETLIRRAYKSNDRTKNGADASFMKNLIDTENAEPHTSHLPKYDKQLLKIRNYLGKAISKILKWKLTEDEKAEILKQQQMLDYASDSSTLMDIVSACNAASNRFISD